MPDDTPRGAATATISNDLVSFAEHLADTARDLALRYFRQGVDVALKSDNTPVTAVDLLAGRQLLATANPALHEQALARLDPAVAS